MQAFTLHCGYVPGALGRIAELHGCYYAWHWQLGAFFEARVARDLGEFMSRYDERRDGLWTAQCGGRIEGSIAIDGLHAERAAHLRWFIAGDALRGNGVGHRLLGSALAFCRERGYRAVELWTFAGLDAARRLYEQAGFVLAEEFDGTQWGRALREQRFQLALA
ncbi:GNAT family N-acetyltransferase [Solimonas soli]|uniref:GNAT family N-acetyltransferase n=1 Tax=Solimonas soli TaxID=413479 RepID=UPI0004B7E8D8|nr:GNAT family N-acetyltransferase [Solimonas soli]